ncbi:type II toxin-antitoxin system RelE/ParE family toxin [Candidatus Micrarchaeota archaeon]|nr:type II toxin-antitoxin system RelE/ParE family toxin [Candidatus Micrarchaeota archaeon]
MYTIILTNKVKKKYEDLDEKYFKRFQDLFLHLETHPYPADEYDFVKLGGMNDCYRIRIGDYRISYYIDTTNGIIRVFELERREKAYK